MSSIYTLTNDLRALMFALQEQDGVLTDEQEVQLAITQQELEAKGVNYALAIRELNVQADAIDAEIKRLQGLKKSNEKVADRLKHTIDMAMQEFGVEKIESALIKMSYRKSKETVIDNEAFLPDECFETKRTVSKTKVKEYITKHGEVPGASIVEKLNLQIK